MVAGQKTPESFTALLKAMLAKDPKQRINAASLLDHPFLADNETPKSFEKEAAPKRTFFPADAIMEKVKVKSTVTVSLKPKCQD